MPFTNFPGGVASFGVPMAGQGSLYDMPSGEVIFVCNRAGVVNGDGTQRDRPKASIADAIAGINTTSGLATGAATIFVLSGHAENVTGSNIFSGSTVNTTAVAIPAGTRIIGEGFGTARPVITFAAAASTVAFAAANCSWENMILQCPQSGTTTVAAMFTVTAAGCTVRGCQFQMATSATALVTTGISLSSAASDTFVLDNNAYATTGTPTSWVSTTGTTGPTRVSILRNVALLPLSAVAGGLVDCSSASGTAPTNWVVADNTLVNQTASSTAAIKGVAGWTGIVAYNNLGIMTATSGATTAITPNSTVSVQSFQNFVSSPHLWAIVGGGSAAQA
jgi:hypothetical protein